MSAPATLADALRERILDGDLAPDEPLREQALTARYGLARHTVRAALRALAAEGLVRVEPNRGARVTAFSPDDLEALGALRTALEVEAARLALELHGGLPPEVHAAQAALAAACAGESFAAVSRAHEALHGAIVAASRSPRIIAAHAALAGELRLFLTHLRPAWDVPGIAASHERLLHDLETLGAEVLRDHIAESTRALKVYAAECR